MRCQCITHFGRPLEGEDRADMTPQGSEVILEVLAAGVCHTDCTCANVESTLATAPGLNMPSAASTCRGRSGTSMLAAWSLPAARTGAIQPIPTPRFPPSEAEYAMNGLEAGGVIGRAVLTPD